MRHPTDKRRKVRKIVGRSFLCLGTLVVFVIAAAYGYLYSVVNGPSPAFRDRLVLSALEGSATKWLPNLFLPQETIDSIVAESQRIDTDTLSLSDYLPAPEEAAGADGVPAADEWEGHPDGIRIEIVTGATYKAYVMLVRDPASVFVGPTYDYHTAGSGKQVFTAVEMENAVAAINAGEFSDIGGVSTGAQPMGLTYSKGHCVWDDGFYSTFMGFDRENRLIVRNGLTRGQADALGIRDGVSFRGQEGDNVLITSEDGNVNFHYASGDNAVAQRTAIGQRADKTVILLVTDGRTASSLGATRNDIIDVFKKYGAVSAGRLDGGSSAMMYYRDYTEKYQIPTEDLNETQKRGMVNNFKAFTGYRYIPTYFMVSGG